MIDPKALYEYLVTWQGPVVSLNFESNVAKYVLDRSFWAERKDQNSAVTRCFRDPDFETNLTFSVDLNSGACAVTVVIPFDWLAESQNTSAGTATDEDPEGRRFVRHFQVTQADFNPIQFEFGTLFYDVNSSIRPVRRQPMPINELRDLLGLAPKPHQGGSEWSQVVVDAETRQIQETIAKLSQMFLISEDLLIENEELIRLVQAGKSLEKLMDYISQNY